MTNNTDDVNAILNGKYGLQYAGNHLTAMKAVTQAHANRSLKDFQNVLNQYSEGIFEF
jgi:26S proteasome regulatory complex component